MKRDDLTVEIAVEKRRRPIKPGKPDSPWAHRRSCGLAVLAAAAAIALAGCGGGSKSPAVASVATTTTSSSAASSTNGKASSGSTTPGTTLANAPLAYSRCMRSHGVPNFPDPNPGGGFTFHPGGIDPSSPAFTAAQAKCQKLMGGPAPGSTTHPTAQWLAHMVKVAQCMRRHGITNFPDPRTSVPSNPFPAGSGGGVISDIEGVILIFPAATIDMQSPTFTRAAAACQFPLHNH
jgi:hypothetical protein